MIRSCGMEGFKNTRKGTNIAAQATAIGLATVSFYYWIFFLRISYYYLSSGETWINYVSIIYTRGSQSFLSHGTLEYFLKN